MTVARFYSVGLACALLHNAIVIGFDFAGLHYLVSTTVSFAVVVVVGYRLHSRWTFPGGTRAPASFGRYAAVMSANWPLSVLGLFLFADLLGLPMAAASPLVTVLLAAMNYLGSRWALRVGTARGIRG